MRLIHNCGLYPSCRMRLAGLHKGGMTLQDAINVSQHNRFGACHFLKSVLDRNADAFFANVDDEAVPRIWAMEQGMKSDLSLDQMLLAQIEHHRTEVFNNLDPMRYGDSLLARLRDHVLRRWS